jgi:predicted esterase
MHEQHLPVTRTARFWTMGESGPAIRQVWFVLHGYGQLAGRFITRFRALESTHRLIVAPEGLNRFYLDGGMGPHTAESRVGATWMTREDRLTEIEDYVHYLESLYRHTFAALARAADAADARAHAGVEVIVLGFSQGVATAARWVSRTEQRIDRLVLWAGGFPPELDPAPGLFGAARLTFVRGEKDAFASGAAVRTLRTRIEGGGMPYEEIVFAGGHELDDDVLRRVAGDTQASRSG